MMWKTFNTQHSMFNFQWLETLNSEPINSELERGEP